MKTETLTTLDMHEFDQLVEEHLGIKVKDYDVNIHDWVGDWDGIQGRELNNGSYVRFYANSEPYEWDNDATRYAVELFKKGVLPADQDVVVWIDW